MHALVRKNSIYLLLERTITPVITFLITIFIVKKLSVDEFGIYNLLLTIMGYAVLMSSLGLPGIFQRYIPEFYQNKKLGQMKRLVEKGLVWGFVINAVIASLLVLFSEKIGRFLKIGNALDYLVVFSVAIIFYFNCGLMGITLTSIFQHKKYVLAQIMYTVSRAGLLVYLLSQGKGLVGLLLTESFSFVFLFFVLFYHFRRFMAKHKIEDMAELPFKRLLRFGGYSYFNEVGEEILNVTTDFLIITIYLGPIAVGIYAFANKVMKLLYRVLPQTMLMEVIRPAFFTRYTLDDRPEQLNKMFNFLVKINALFIFPLVTGVFLMGDKLIIHVFDAKYLESLHVLWIVAAFTAFHFFMFPIGLVLQSLEKVQILFYSKIFAIFNLVVNLLVVKAYGVLGIAVVTGFSVLLKNIFCYLFAVRFIRLRMDFRSLGRIAINAGLLGIFLYSIRELVTNLLLFIVVVLVGGVFYIGLARLNRAFSQDERSAMNKILPAPVFPF